MFLQSFLATAFLGSAGFVSADPVATQESHPCGDGYWIDTVETEQGHTYTFCADDDDGVGVIAITPLGHSNLNDGRCPLDIYKKMTPPGTPIPAELDGSCDRLRPVPSIRQESFQAMQFRSDFCGPDGQNAFANQKCPTGSNNLKHFDWCLSAKRSGWVQYTASTQMGERPDHAKVNVAACHGSAHLDFWKKEKSGSSWYRLFNQDVAPNNSVSTSWWAGKKDNYNFDRDDYRARVESIGNGRFRFGGSYVRCKSVFAQCFQ